MKTKFSSKIRNSLLAVVSIVFAITFGTALGGLFNTTARAEATGIKGSQISLSEDIVVKYTTDATADEYLSVQFKGKTTKITEHTDGVFEFKGVTPQLFNEVMTVGLYSASDVLIGEEQSMSVAGYLYNVLSMDYETSGCTSQKQYSALRELAVDMLKYGSAAQTYVNYDVENLADSLLTSTQQELATGEIEIKNTDKNVVDDVATDNVAWVGAGVRFDYKLGLYYVFSAENTDGITLKINGETVDYAPYGDASNKQYVAYYNGFSALDMNTVISAVLYNGETQIGKYDYSLKSYVYAKGGQQSALATLVKATYAYGYAAVAYDAEYEVIDPTFDSNGYVTMSNARGYDYSNSIYGAVELPAFNTTDYTVATVKNRDTGADISTTTFTLKENDKYVFNYTAQDVLNLNGNFYNEYTLNFAQIENATISRDATSGDYAIDVANGQTANITYVATFGSALTITGNLNVNATTRLSCNENFYVGTAEKTANLYFNNDGSGNNKEGIGMWNGADLYVRSGSKFTLNASTSGTAALYLYHKGTRVYVEDDATIDVTGAWTYGAQAMSTNVSVIVDGKLTTSAKMYSAYAITNDMSFPYGVVPLLWVRSGEAILGDIYQANHLIVGDEDSAGTLTINGKSDDNPLRYNKSNNSYMALCYAFINGTVNLNAAVAGKTGIDVRGTAVDIIVHKEVTLNTTNCSWLLGQWSALGAYKFMFENGVTVNMPDRPATDSGVLNMGKASASKPVYLINFDVQTVNIDGTEREVMVLKYSANTASTKTQSVGTFDGLVDGAEYVTGTTTFDAGRLGTFTQATTGTGESVYYRTAEWTV